MFSWARQVQNKVSIVCRVHTKMLINTKVRKLLILASKIKTKQSISIPVTVLRIYNSEYVVLLLQYFNEKVTQGINHFNI